MTNRTGWGVEDWTEQRKAFPLFVFSSPSLLRSKLVQRLMKTVWTSDCTSEPRILFTPKLNTICSATTPALRWNLDQLGHAHLQTDFPKKRTRMSESNKRLDSKTLKQQNQESKYKKGNALDCLRRTSSSSFSSEIWVSFQLLSPSFSSKNGRPLRTLPASSSATSNHLFIFKSFQSSITELQFRNLSIARWSHSFFSRWSVKSLRSPSFLRGREMATLNFHSIQTGRWNHDLALLSLQLGSDPKDTI